ncbi:hypothetical protein ACPUYX_00550 [Desulfosporosinus sp. SYSU MS00001]|uniref:hypothetical protein n=1 Tax=Desulfosporosinus sp. SYSU MS00001 TaxID=3416284 RepID=UPI003CEBF03F
MKRFVGNFLYVLFVGVITYWGEMYGQHIKSETFHLYPLYMFISIYPIVIGILLALPGLFLRIRQKGKWTIDWQLLIPIGVPTFIININILLNKSFSLYQFEWFRLMISSTRIFDISGIVCGYVLISSLKRTNSKESTLDEKL